MAKKYKLLKDIQTPFLFIPAGTVSVFSVSVPKPYSYLNTLSPGHCHFSDQEIIDHPDFFEEVQEPRWNDKQMIEFGKMAVTACLHDQNHIEQLFEKWKNKHGHE